MRRRLLFLSQCLPFPAHSGVTRRTRHILKELQRSFDVTLVAFSRRDHQPDDMALATATQNLRLELSEVLAPIPIGSDRSLRRKIRNHLRSVLSKEPYIFYEYDDASFSRELRDALDRTEPDLIHLDSLDLYGWLDSLPPAPTTCTHHNIESELLRRQAHHFPNVLGRRYMRYQADLVEKVERRLAPSFDLNVMTSDVDANRLRTLAPTARTAVIPNGVDTDFFQPAPLARMIPGRVVFLGPTYMFPNRDAVEFFLADVWPAVRRKRPDSTLNLVGKVSDENKARFERSPGVACTGHVPDVRRYLAEAAVSIVPIRVGGGTRLKILDAWAMGKAVVSTAVGCEGLNTVDGENILIRDDPADFADAVIRVLSDEELRNSLGEAGRRTAERFYSWAALGTQLVTCYDRLIRSRSCDTAAISA